MTVALLNRPLPLTPAPSRDAAARPATAEDERDGLAAAAATDSELMTRVAEGDAAAFAALVDRHKDALVRYLARLGGERARAEDLAQEAFLRLYATAARYREQERLLAYLYRIATNLLRSEERRRRRWRLLEPLLRVAPHGEPGPQARALAGELQREVARAVAALPLAFRVPLVLHEIEEWSCAAIADLVGCREGTVRTRLHRARRRLRAALAPYVSRNGASR